MTRRNRCRVAVGCVLATCLSAWTMMAGAAPTSPSSVVGKIKENAAIAPRFEPTPPTKLDEFSQDPNLKSVHFAFGKAELREADATIVDRDARWLNANQPYEVMIEGYADERGSKAYNQALAKRRAVAVRDELVARGIRRDRIALVAYGEARPECHDKVKDEACFGKNRRADILVRRAPVQTP